MIKKGHQDKELVEGGTKKKEMNRTQRTKEEEDGEEEEEEDMTEARIALMQTQPQDRSQVLS